MQTLRQALAEAKIALRRSKDDYDIVTALCEHKAIEKAGGTIGGNEESRKRNLKIALANDGNWGNAREEWRDAEADIANEEHELRMREVAAREKLAAALLGRRSDDAAIDTLSRVEAAQRRGYRQEQTEEDVHWQQHTGTYDIPDTTEWFGR